MRYVEKRSNQGIMASVLLLLLACAGRHTSTKPVPPKPPPASAATPNTTPPTKQPEAKRPRPPERGVAAEPTATVRREPEDLTMSVVLTVKEEDGAPTLHYAYTFENRSQTDAYLNLYGTPSWWHIRKLVPKRLFRITPHQLRPYRMAPPTQTHVLLVPAGGTATFSRWDWVGVFLGTHDETKRQQNYELVKPGRATLSLCYASPASASQVEKFVPDGASLWSGREICAKAASIDLRPPPTTN